MGGGAMVIVLGVDQAKVSGWALFADARLLAHGVARTAEQRHRVCLRAAAMARAQGGALLLMLEDHQDTTRDALRAAKRGQVKTSADRLLSLGASRGKWEQSWELVAGQAPKAMVTPRAWRRAILGIPADTPRAECKRLAQLWAKQSWGLDVTHDEAEAIAIARYGAVRARLQPP